MVEHPRHGFPVSLGPITKEILLTTTDQCQDGWSHLAIVGHGGALVESIAFNQRVVGSTPALAAM